MAANIYVGNLSYSVTEDALRDLFSNFGSVESVKIVNDTYSGKSKGFGFVEMSNKDEAQKAIDNLNGSDFEGRTMKVNEARPREERSSGGNNNYRRRD
jgi:RNA recognition motif-containing protein